MTFAMSYQGDGQIVGQAYVAQSTDVMSTLQTSISDALIVSRDVKDPIVQRADLSRWHALHAVASLNARFVGWSCEWHATHFDPLLCPSFVVAL